MTLDKRIEQSEHLIYWLDDLIDGLSIPSSDRARIAGACLDMALEHQKAIVLTTSGKLHGTAYSLIRSEFEAYIRGVWFVNCATDADVKRFLSNKKIKRTFGEMIADLETHDRFNVGVLSHIKSASWSTMCSFTHTGLFQVIRRLNATEVTSVYPEEEIIAGLDMADGIAHWAALAIVEMTTGAISEKENMAQSILDRAREFASNG